MRSKKAPPKKAQKRVFEHDSIEMSTALGIARFDVLFIVFQSLVTACLTQKEVSRSVEEIEDACSQPLYLRCVIVLVCFMIAELFLAEDVVIDKVFKKVLNEFKQMIEGEGVGEGQMEEVMDGIKAKYSSPLTQVIRVAKTGAYGAEETLKSLMHLPTKEIAKLIEELVIRSPKNGKVSA